MGEYNSRAFLLRWVGMLGDCSLCIHLGTRAQQVLTGSPSPGDGRRARGRLGCMALFVPSLGSHLFAFYWQEHVMWPSKVEVQRHVPCLWWEEPQNHITRGTDTGKGDVVGLPSTTGTEGHVQAVKRLAGVCVEEPGEKTRGRRTQATTSASGCCAEELGLVPRAIGSLRRAQAAV